MDKDYEGIASKSCLPLAQTAKATSLDFSLIMMVIIEIILHIPIIVRIRIVVAVAVHGSTCISVTDVAFRFLEVFLGLTLFRSEWCNGCNGHTGGSRRDGGMGCQGSSVGRDGTMGMYNDEMGAGSYGGVGKRQVGSMRIQCRSNVVVNEILDLLSVGLPLHKDRMRACKESAGDGNGGEDAGKVHGIMVIAIGRR